MYLHKGMCIEYYRVIKFTFHYYKHTLHKHSSTTIIKTIKSITPYLNTIMKILYIYILKSISAIFRFIVNYSNVIITYTNKKVELSDKGYLSLVRSVYQPKGRYIELTYSNNYLLEQYKVLKELHKSLFSNDEFLKFGYQKVIIVMAVVGKQTFSFHHNILINNNTTFKQYYNQIKDHINDLHDDGYEINKVNYFKVLVWNVDHLANKNIKITKDATNAVTSLSTTVGQIKLEKCH